MRLERTENQFATVQVKNADSAIIKPGSNKSHLERMPPTGYTLDAAATQTNGTGVMASASPTPGSPRRHTQKQHASVGGECHQVDRLLVCSNKFSGS
ncbi:hypothetical protein RHS01_11239 [Rhizoctonia solani]|uniref:Uncharacterized protein n=1 Tax=Rhizoctonia solani TaxID=456999 RepID=A0A8H7I3G7_9AGAM|nr:hypothetical protein RHS01_11239 [Rhizoctonia solani]